MSLLGVHPTLAGWPERKTDLECVPWFSSTAVEIILLLGYSIERSWAVIPLAAFRLRRLDILTISTEASSVLFVVYAMHLTVGSCGIKEYNK